MKKIYATPITGLSFVSVKDTSLPKTIQYKNYYCIPNLSDINDSYRNMISLESGMPESLPDDIYNMALKMAERHKDNNWEDLYTSYLFFYYEDIKTDSYDYIVEPQIINSSIREYPDKEQIINVPYSYLSLLIAEYNLYRNDNIDRSFSKIHLISQNFLDIIFISLFTSGNIELYNPRITLPRSTTSHTGITAFYEIDGDLLRFIPYKKQIQHNKNIIIPIEILTSSLEKTILPYSAIEASTSIQHTVIKAYRNLFEASQYHSIDSSFLLLISTIEMLVDNEKFQSTKHVQDIFCAIVSNDKTQFNKNHQFLEYCHREIRTEIIHRAKTIEDLGKKKYIEILNQLSLLINNYCISIANSTNIEDIHQTARLKNFF